MVPISSRQIGVRTKFDPTESWHLLLQRINRFCDGLSGDTGEVQSFSGWTRSVIRGQGIFNRSGIERRILESN